MEDIGGLGEEYWDQEDIMTEEERKRFFESSKSEHYKSIEEFHRKADQQISNIPTVPDEQTRVLRAKLILEEAFETIEALGVGVGLDLSAVPMSSGGPCVFIKNIDHMYFDTYGREVDMVEIADGVADLSYVAVGTLVSLGIPDGPIIRAVEESNLSKFREGWSKRADGKILKSPKFEPPNIERLLKYYGWREE